MALTISPTEMRGEIELADAAIVQQIARRRGVLTEVARALKVTRGELELRIAASPAAQQAVIDSRAEWMDLAIAKLLEAVEDGKPWAVKFLIESMGGGGGAA